MSKSLDNYIGVTEPAAEMFGKLMSVPDEAMPPVLAAAARRGARPGAATPARPSASSRAVVCDRFHGEAPAREAEARFDSVHVRHGIPDDVPEVEHRGGDGQVHLPALLREPSGSQRSARPGG